MPFGVTSSKSKSFGVVQSSSNKVGVVPSVASTKGSKLHNPYKKSEVKMPVKSNDNYPPRNSFEKLAMN